MAVIQILTTDTLEQMRVKINTLSATAFGDIATLPESLAATSVIGAVIELADVVQANEGFFIRDETSSVQSVGAGQTLNVVGGSNQITAVVSSPDTLTIGLAPDVIITGNLTAQGALHSFGTISINNDQISSSSTAQISIADRLIVENSELRVTDSGGGILTIGDTDSSFITHSGGSVRFGSSNPTADRTITFPNITGTVITSADTGTVTNTMLAGSITGAKLLDDTITEAKIADDAVGQDQLKSVVNLQILNSSGGILKSIYGAGA
jgi:hypothetical protein